MNEEGLFAEVEALFRQEAGQQHKPLGEQDERTDFSFVFLGKVLADVGKLAEAEQAFSDGQPPLLLITTFCCGPSLIATH